LVGTPVILHTYLPVMMEQTERSETSAFKIQKPGNHPEESMKLGPFFKHINEKNLLALSCVSVRLSAFIGMTLAGQISIKFYIQDFY
jgi:hypothetical protein